uniref:CS domain-containing protein n=1 Tax=Panagrolaimus sp. JU765 TaxID=591449 RepID=A0AC34QTZ4_9BILA
MATTPKHPMIYWAQRKNTLMLSVAVEDFKVDKLEFKDNVFVVKGSDKANQLYEANLNLYDKVIPENYHKVDTTRQLELVIAKAEANWWPRLLKESTKVPWIKVDFNKWVDEEDEVEADDNFDFGGDFPADFDPSGLGDLGDDEPPELEDAEEPTTSKTAQANSAETDA